MTPASRSEPFWRALYGWVLLPCLLGVVHIAALVHSKLRASLRGRHGLWKRLGEQAAARDGSRPLVWIHAASAGELLQALPVLERLLAQGAQGAITVTSVSGLRWAERQRERLSGVIVADYLPTDTRRHARRLLDLLRPDALVYVKYDLWPNLLWAARDAGVRQYLLAATLHEGSRRQASPWSRAFYRALYPALDTIWPVDPSHAERFHVAAPGHPGIETLGDPRFDNVTERRNTERRATEEESEATSPRLPGLSQNARVIVAGSTWPGDEVRLVPPLREAMQRHEDLVLILAPHEIEEEHLQDLATAFEDFSPIRWTDWMKGNESRGKGSAEASEPSEGSWRVLLVDVVGQLFDLYAEASVAYVGGGFGEGVHNVLEPCAQGAPVMFGPRNGNDPAAQAMVDAGVAWVVTQPSEVDTRLVALLEDPGGCAALGARAQAFVTEHIGASDRAAERIAAGWA